MFAWSSGLMGFSLVKCLHMLRQFEYLEAGEEVAICNQSGYAGTELLKAEVCSLLNPAQWQLNVKRFLHRLKIPLDWSF